MNYLTVCARPLRTRAYTYTCASDIRREYAPHDGARERATPTRPPTLSPIHTALSPYGPNSRSLRPRPSEPTEPTTHAPLRAHTNTHQPCPSTAAFLRKTKKSTPRHHMLSRGVSRAAASAPGKRSARRGPAARAPMIIYSMTARRSSPSTLSPAETVRWVTVPDLEARMTVSIFIAESTAIWSPSDT